MISQISGNVRHVVALLTMENNETCCVTLSATALKQLAELPIGTHIKVTGNFHDKLGVHNLGMDADCITAT